MDFLVIFLPTVILISSVLAYDILKREVSKYLVGLKKRVEIKYRIMNLLFLRKIVTFFSESNTSHLTEDVLNSLSSKLDEDAETLARKALPEVEELHESLNLIRMNSHDYYVVETLYSILINMVFIFGVTVSLVQYILLFLIFRGQPTLFLDLINVVIVAATMVFGGVVFLVTMEIISKTRKISTAPNGEAFGKGYIKGQPSGDGKK